MSLYFYAENESASSRKLFNQLEELKCGGVSLPVRRIRNLVFNSGLQVRVGDILILFANTPEELDAIVSKKELLSSCRIFLVLPDSTEKTIHSGHKLRPRFIDFKGNCQETLLKVIEKAAVQENSSFVPEGGQLVISNSQYLEVQL